MSKNTNGVKKFFEIAKAVLEFIGRLAEITGDSLAGIKVATSLCNQFIEKRKSGELKDVDFLTYLEALSGLVVSLAPYANDLLEDSEELVNVVVKFFEFKKEYATLNANKAGD